MRIHLDLGSGIAGDMFMAACLDLGLDRDELKAALSTMPLPDGWDLIASKDKKAGIAGTHVDVAYPHEHAHRHLSHIAEMIENSELPAPVQDKAKAIFRTLAEAEAQVHGTTPEKVHFHEVGAVDSIVDVCGAAYAYWRLGIKEVTATKVPTGSGYVVCQHGRMPIPVPAVVEIFKRHDVPTVPDDIESELVTPTGAAILVNIVDGFSACPLGRVDRIGYGLGTRDLPGRANALRILAQDEDATDADGPALIRETIAVLTTNIDDMNPEWYGGLWETLMDEGAVDVAMIPMTMKKGRPAVRLEVMAPLGKENRLAALILKNTTAIGLRVQQMDRLILPRESLEIETPWGKVRAKEAGGVAKVEFDDLARLAKERGWSLPEAGQRVAPYLADKDQ